MRASCSSSWAGIVPRRVPFPLTLALIWIGLTGIPSFASALTAPRGAAAADTGGFSVRVVEEGQKGSHSTLRGAISARTRVEARTTRGSRTPEPPEPPDTLEEPEPPNPPGDLDEGDDYVRFGEDITIPEGKTVHGDVVAIGGDVTVFGHVTGDCVSVGGTVQVRGKGIVDGDAVAMGGGVSTSDSGSVGGRNVSLGGTFPFRHSARFWPMMGYFGALGTGIWILQALVKLGLTILFAWVALLLAKERLTYAVDSMYRHFGRSFLWGLAGLAVAIMALPTGTILIIIVGVIAIAILCITIIGIPVAILLLIAMVLGIAGMVLGLLIAIFLGYLNGAMFLGQRVLGRNSSKANRPILAILAGVTLLTLLEIAGKLIGLVGLLVFHPIAIALGIAAGALAVILTIAGFGALILSRFATGPRGEGALGSQWWPRGRPRPEAGPTTPEQPVEPKPAPPEGGSSDAP
jgi:hypothetical protein